MPPENSAVETSVRALSLWRQLAIAYDDITLALACPEGGELRTLAQRILELEEDLRPMVVRIAQLRAELEAEPGLTAIWNETDAVIESLASRQPALVRTAIGARDEAAAALARSQVARSQSAAYRTSRSTAPSFTSRRA